jgi:hypothetical protein
MTSQTKENEGKDAWRTKEIKKIFVGTTWKKTT